MERMIAAQGGDPNVARHPDKLALAPVVVPIEADVAGYVTEVDALELGLAGVAMGAGRTRADQRVDHAVGIELGVARGDRVERGAVLAKLFVRRTDDAEAVKGRVHDAFRIADAAPSVPPLVLARIG
jgi:pyrimidine-nucleoside phosphorylase